MLDLILLIGAFIWFFFIRQIKMAGKGALSFGKSKARLLAKERNKTTFKDVAGIEEAIEEVSELVEFLKDQHNLIKDMFEEVLSASSTEAREKSFTSLRQLLAVHETAEEMVVHPRARHEIADGDTVIDALLHVL